MAAPFGLSVIALHIIHFIMKHLFRNKIKLHADEPTKIRSKKYIYDLINKSNFKGIGKNNVGFSDAFTYYIITLKNYLELKYFPIPIHCILDTFFYY